MQVNILEAKNRLSELVRRVQAGEDVIIANRGRAVARLVAEAAASEGVAKQSGQTLRDWRAAHPLPAYAQKTAAEIDAMIEDERNAWD